MKFITEEDLRNLFRKEPFTTYELKEGERLTPGAREFLSDKINKSQSNNLKSIDTIIKEEKNIKVNWKKKKFQNKLKSTELIFLDTAQELLSKDVLLSQSIINLGKQLVSIENITGETNVSMSSYFKECAGIKEVNLKEDLDDCFEITEFHIQLKKGRELIILYKLRCAIKELEPFILELFENDEDEKEFTNIAIGKINETANILSQIICSILGGKTCQRRS